MSDTKDRMQDIGQAVNERVPEGFGFFVLVFPFKGESRANYVSNANREDVINVMKEFLIRSGHESDWMKHI